METTERLTLVQIADRITAHLKRFAGDAEINKVDKKYRTSPYWNSGASASGSRVFVTYVSYQGRHRGLSKSEALAYLAWLDAGNVGKHWEMGREEKS